MGVRVHFLDLGTSWRCSWYNAFCVLKADDMITGSEPDARQIPRNFYSSFNLIVDLISIPSEDNLDFEVWCLLGCYAVWLL
jgi:hypothetical protein